MIEITVSRRSELQGAEADVIQSLVIQTETEIRVLHELVHGEGAVVRFNHSVAYLRRGHDGVRRHHTIRILLADFADKKRTHSGASATAERVRHLETLEAIASLGLLTDNVQHRVNELCALSVVAFCPVVASTGLAEHEVIRAEELAKRTRANRVHGARLQIHEDRTRHVAAAGGLVIVHVDALELQVRVTVTKL